MPKAEIFLLEEGQHSPLGPSSGERWMNCPGSVLLTIDMPDRDSEYSTLGTAGHTVTEWARNEGADAKEYLGRKVEVPLAQGGTKIIVVDQQMVDCTNEFVGYTDSLGGEMLCEAQVCYDEWVEKAFGTADDIRLQNGIVPVTDYKYGEGVMVFAENNTQLKLYALGVFQDYGWLYDIKGFRLAIFQPRLDHVDEWEISVEDLLAWADTEVAPAAKLAMGKAAPFKAGKWCQFCKAKSRCKTRAQYAHEVLYADDFEDLDEKVPETKDIQLLTNVEIGLLLPRLEYAGAFAKDLETEAYAQIGKGNAIPHPVTGDYKLVAGRSNRVWAKPEDKVAEELIASEDISEDDMYAPQRMLGPAPIEKILGKKHELMAGEKSLVKKPPGKPKLVPGTDKREALEIKAEDEFEDV